ncbi:transcriptional regulator, IclR family [Hoeflea sp. IMCC20628]|uniref:IclR family transcriptional regulator n=1 Tax=Hoeflea sp. IMCC20628 TaxID=1620421 RepID=UPI00063A8CFF|nr:IclR family transcriptional regulator [Hoeflea sp. IMCC20628]AKI01802.1 transcriptional regulator, IclR family [Hoeflea sp. IMCC20628]
MTVAAIDRAISMIELLASVPESMELSEIAATVGLPTSAAHRTLATLMSRGWVIQDPASQTYALSLRMGLLAFRNLDTRYIPDLANEVLHKLAAKTQEYCRLAMADNGGLTWIARAQGARQGLRYDPDMGAEIVLHATANGKAWLSTLTEAEALKMAFVEGLGTLKGMGPNYITDVDSFRQHLNSARLNGYATAVDEGEAGATALAVPFFCSEAPDAAVAGTISVAGPTLRMRPARYAEISRELQVAAREMTAIWPLRIRQRDFTARDPQASLAP